MDLFKRLLDYYMMRDPRIMYGAGSVQGDNEEACGVILKSARKKTRNRLF
jgi:hypothetical protein